MFWFKKKIEKKVAKKVDPLDLFKKDILKEIKRIKYDIKTRFEVVWKEIPKMHEKISEYKETRTNDMRYCVEWNKQVEKIGITISNLTESMVHLGKGLEAIEKRIQLVNLKGQELEKKYKELK
jgi:predicted  nucleic acid-binding Zn-ribbon protein